MNNVLNYLNKKGFMVSNDYYSHIEKWKNIWKGQGDWLSVKTTNENDYELFSLNIAKRSCEDFASNLTSESYEINSSESNDLINDMIKSHNIMGMLPLNIEKMAYTGTIATIVSVKGALVINGELTRNEDTKVKVTTVDAQHIIPLKLENGKIVDACFVSSYKKIINNETKTFSYLELHQLQKKGYQITNVFLNDEGKKIQEEGIQNTYNTLSNVPLFSICKVNKLATLPNDMGLGASIYSEAIKQLRIIDLTYNNFGTDFKLGQKLLIVNRKLTQEQIVETPMGDGTVKKEKKITYPENINKQLFVESGDSLINKDDVYMHEYNPDLRVGDNKEGTQFAIDIYSFMVGFGTKYYQFDSSGGVTTATQYNGERQDLVSNGVKNRKAVKNYLIGVIRALLLIEKMLGEQVDENIEINIPDVDNFLEDDEMVLQRGRTEVSQGLMSKYTYLTKYKKLTPEEAQNELNLISGENVVNFSSLGT